MGQRRPLTHDLSMADGHLVGHTHARLFTSFPWDILYPVCADSNPSEILPMIRSLPKAFPFGLLAKWARLGRVGQALGIDQFLGSHLKEFVVLVCPGNLPYS